MLDRVRKIKREYPHIQVIGGNIASADAALALVEAGADAVKWALAQDPFVLPEL